MKKKSRSLLIKNAEYVATFNKNNEILKNCSVFIENNIIKEISTKKTTADCTINARGKIVLPGFINCHHHIFQCGLRGFPKLQNQKIDKWIQIVCEFSKKLNEEIMYYSALANIAELLLYGCTTTTDMHYIFPKNNKGLFEATIQAAADIGIRFHPYRGSISLSEKDGTMFPDDVVQDSDMIASESEECIRKYHISSRLSLLRIGLAPCTIFTSSKEDYQKALLLAKKYQINIQTHLAESEFEDKYSMKKFRKRPLQYLHDLGWFGRRVSFVHCINLNNTDLNILQKTNTHVVHCPISNARSPIGEIGIAPIWEMLGRKINVSVGVDGSAGNDSSNMLEELRWARILQGVRKESTYLKSIDVLKIGTINGAKLLHWEDEIGSIEKGKAADISIFDWGSMIEQTGAIHSPLNTLFACQAIRAHTVIVDGKIIVDNKKLAVMDEKKICYKLNKLLRSLYYK